MRNHRNGQRMNGDRRKEAIRYAVVGLGYIAQGAVLPAFEHAQENSRLGALVSDDPEKLKQLSKKYRVDATFSYEQYENCLRSGLVDAVFIALPNHLHAEYTIKAAEAGVHILCEKPLAVTTKECRDMIDAARANGVKLMTAYRLHFEEANLKAVEMIKSGTIGDVRIFNSVFSQQVEEGNIRVKRETGGGTLYDLGIYCINAARYLLQAEPVEVTAFSANNGEKRFKEVDEMSSVIMRFPDEQLACFTSSFGAAGESMYEVVGTTGSLKMEKAYKYSSERTITIVVNEKEKTFSFKPTDQFAPELVYFSECIHTGAEPEPSGEEGMIDVNIIEALYRSAESGKPVSIKPLQKHTRPHGKMKIKKPKVRKPKLVNASDPRP